MGRSSGLVILVGWANLVCPPRGLVILVGLVGLVVIPSGLDYSSGRVILESWSGLSYRAGFS